jgi:hypothetical protein
VDKVRQDNRISIEISFGYHHLLKMLLLVQYCRQVINGKDIDWVWVSASGPAMSNDLQN